jgi:hypothetical protein
MKKKVFRERYGKTEIEKEIDSIVQEIIDNDVEIIEEKPKRGRKKVEGSVKRGRKSVKSDK